MTEVWACGPEGQADLLVMLALADWCNDAGECWPSMASVAQKARVEERSARRIVRRLEDDGWLEIAVGGGRHGCNKYTLKLGPKVPRTKSPPDLDAHKPGLSVQETRTRRSPEPSITIKEPSKSIAREKLVLILSEVASERAANDFIDHRKAKRAPMTERAARMIADDLRNHPDPDKVIDASIKNGWTGVFPDKVQAPSARLFDLSKFKG